MKTKCKLCGKVCANNTGLAQHIRFNHKEARKTPNGAPPSPLEAIRETRAGYVRKVNLIDQAITALERAFARD